MNCAASIFVDTKFSQFRDQDKTEWWDPFFVGMTEGEIISEGFFCDREFTSKKTQFFSEIFEQTDHFYYVPFRSPFEFNETERVEIAL